MARGDAVSFLQASQNTGDVLAFLNHTKSETLVTLFDDTLALKHATWIDAGHSTLGLAAQPGDTFAVANEDGLLLYEHTVPLQSRACTVENKAKSLINVQNELDAAMRLMRLLDEESAVLLSELDFVDKQLARTIEKALHNVQEEKNADILFHSEQEFLLDSGERYGVIEASGEEKAGCAWQLTRQLDHEAKMLADQMASDLMCLLSCEAHKAGDQGVHLLLAKDTQQWRESCPTGKEGPERMQHR